MRNANFKGSRAQTQLKHCRGCVDSLGPSNNREGPPCGCDKRHLPLWRLLSAESEQVSQPITSTIPSLNSNISVPLPSPACSLLPVSKRWSCLGPFLDSSPSTQVLASFSIPDKIFHEQPWPTNRCLLCLLVA